MGSAEEVVAALTDTEPRGIAYGVADRLGMRPEILRACRGFYAALRSRWVVQGAFSTEFTRPIGFLQGCALSMLSCVEAGPSSV